MATGRTAVVPSAGAAFVIKQVPIPTPQHGEVIVKTSACGLCHSDGYCKMGHYPGVTFPRAPGHEVVGHIFAVGPGVEARKIGQRIGVGWLGAACKNCFACRSSDMWVVCQNLKVTGFHIDGGYAEYFAVPWESTAIAPESLADEYIGPLMCAGLTVYNGLRNSVARPGDLVAISGIGGLGHLGVQFAHHMGFRTVAISNSAAKEEYARKLGAHLYIDMSKTDVGAELMKLGGAKVILATSPDSDTMAKLLTGIGVGGQLLIGGFDVKPMAVSPAILISRRASVVGLASGNARDAEDTLNFAALHKVHPQVEVFPHADIEKAFERMWSGQARFRVVIKY